MSAAIIERAIAELGIEVSEEEITRARASFASASGDLELWLLREGLTPAELDGQLVGSIYVEVRGARGYFGMLSVDPTRQKAGIGRLLVERAESEFRAAGCQAVDIKIVHLRTELPPYYRALGYLETGSEPFVDDSLKQAAHFVVMSKRL